MRTIRIALAAVLLAVAGTAAAQAPAPAAPTAIPHTYLQLRLGFYVPQASDLDGFNNGLAIDGALGYRFSPNLAAELGLGYFSSTADTVSSGGVTVEPKFSGVPITASVKGILPVSPSVDIYGLVGLGLYRVTLEATGSAGGQTATVSFDDTAFGLLLGAGASFDISRSVFLSVDLRYMVAKATFDTAEGNIDSLFLNGGVGFRF
jgi:opacity protein-like surface antigen